MCILHIVFCTVCKYVLSICKLLLVFCTVCPYVNCCCWFVLKKRYFIFFIVIFLHCLSICKLSVVFLHCLEHAHKNFTHQGTCAVVM